jgi:phytoene desaturase
MTRIAVIGSGFSGLSAACFLSKEGYKVTVFEKNTTAGGRARKFAASGFTFDMGPSWYWMPDVFERFFKHFGKTPADYYSLERLDPSYRILFGKDDAIDVPAGVEGLYKMFERLESGSGEELLIFLKEAEYKYRIGIGNLVYKPGLSVREMVDIDIVKNSFRLHLFDSLSSYVKKRFKSERIIQLLEFPVLFLGARAEETPALYSLMNYADMALGTWYPAGGIYKVIDALVSLATSLGVEFEYQSPVQKLEVNSRKLTGCIVNDTFRPFEYVVASADYHHVEQQLLPSSLRIYSETYWNDRVMAPSSLIFYLGVNKRIEKLLHHTLFFDKDFKTHADEIYTNPKWPTSPQFYVCCPSKTDTTVAPAGHENVFILIPVAAGLRSSAEVAQKYFDMVISRIENITGERLRDHIVFQRTYSPENFSADYNAFKGNAYGLANTLRQTAILKPSIVSKKVANLFYTGQLTVPGPGVPPALISGEVVARELIKRHERI